MANSRHKFHYLSAHDSTINAILVALNVDQKQLYTWPPFAADIVIELWKKTKESSSSETVDDYFIQAHYCNQVGEAT